MGKNERAILEAAVDLMGREDILDIAGMQAGRLARSLGKYLDEKELGVEAPENPEVLLPEIRELAEGMNLMTKLMTMVLGSDEEYELRELAGLEDRMGEAVQGGPRTAERNLVWAQNDELEKG